VKRKYNVKVDTGKHLVFSEYVMKMMMLVVISALHGPAWHGPLRCIQTPDRPGLAQ